MGSLYANTIYISYSYRKAGITSLDNELKTLSSFSKDLRGKKTILCKQNLAVVKNVLRELQSIFEFFLPKKSQRKG